MLSSIFSKTLYEKRWGIVWWGLAMFLTTLLVMLLFPVMRDSFGAQLKDVPESLKSILGEAADYQKISGFVELQVLAQMMFLTIIYGIILCVATLSGEENQGTLHTLLAQPVSRSRVYWHKLAACVSALTFISILMAAGIVLGAAVLGESIGAVAVLQASFMQLLLALFLSILAYAIGAATGSRVLAGSIAGIYAFAGYMVTSLAPIADVLEKLNYISPYRYFMTTRVLENGIATKNMIPLLLGSVLLAIIGWYFFTRRNIYQQ